jgi:membrane-associated phospholipid phosphatase
VSAVAMQGLKRVLIPIAVLLAAIIGLGLLITKVLAHTWPFTVEDNLDRELAGDRTESWNAVSSFFSTLASTPVIIGVTVVIAIILRLTLHRWREPLFLAAAVTAQALVFFFATLAIDRSRPQVTHMDKSPPTSSYPSGHTSAAFALYVGLALVLALLVRRTALKWLCWLLVLVPLSVALARLYRGMHHPSDVVASFVNGGVCVAVMASAILDRGKVWGRGARTAEVQAPA